MSDKEVNIIYNTSKKTDRDSFYSTIQKIITDKELSDKKEADRIEQIRTENAED